MAWQMGRICRWTGSGDEFWSDMLHSFVVADLVHVPWLKAHALIHDSPECVGNDVPAPVKTKATRRMEDAIMERTWDALELPHLTTDEKSIIKVADVRALHGEAWVVGNAGNRCSYPKRDLLAEALVRHYFELYPYRETIERTGTGPKEFVARYERYALLANAYRAADAKEGKSLL
jgi:hypothetical protein